MAIRKRAPRPRTAFEEIVFVPLVGAFDIEHATVLAIPGADDEYAKQLDELDEFYRRSERLRDLV